MSIDSSVAKKPFELNSCLSNLAHFLPAQAPLKDFIHHNTLHGFQKHVFFEGLALASRSLGFKVLLNLSEYRDKYHRGEINPEILVACIQEDYPKETPKVILDKLLNDKELPPLKPGKVGQLRTTWKSKHGLDMDERVHPTLFRLLCSYLDQGIAMWDFPSASEQGFLQSVRIISTNGIVGLFSSVRAQKMLLDESLSIESLLTLIVGPDKEFFEPYLIDQQFAHQGWSGLVSTLEANPSTMLKKRAISLHDLVLIELLFELDALETHLGNRWRPLSLDWGGPPPMIFDSSDNLETETFKALKVLHNAFEWTYYDQVLSALHSQHGYPETKENPGMQVLFCIDDRECSFRRHLESTAPDCVTFGTPGFFGVEFYFQPTGGKFYNKLCPAPVSPQYLIREHGKGSGHSKDLHVSKDSHGLGKGLLMTQTIGFWSAARLFLSIFRPRPSSATASSFQHMSPDSELSILCTDPTNRPEGLQEGFLPHEMADRVETLLRSIGLTTDFADLVYLIGHGSSSTNNPHYAAYDCGACSGRPGSVNARVAAFMANHPEVRAILGERGLVIPVTTQFVGALHDTSRDEIQFFDVAYLHPSNAKKHLQNQTKFEQALDLNAKERSRRLELVNSRLSPKVIHEHMKLRSVSLFEPRPELNHATNALCIVGRRSLTQRMFLDRRSFLNSYDYRTDMDGKYLFGILKAAAPVCGGINLEYFFSRTDNEKLGAGSKLPHNVMGLFGVANGYDGDLRPGLPKQMIEVHDPIRLLIVVEHFHQIVLKVIQSHPETLEWFENQWVNLVCIEPDNFNLMRFNGKSFEPYELVQHPAAPILNPMDLIEQHSESLPAFEIKSNHP